MAAWRNLSLRQEVNKARAFIGKEPAKQFHDFRALSTEAAIKKPSHPGNPAHSRALVAPLFSSLELKEENRERSTKMKILLLI
jgi:hypothetical protein